MTFDDAAFFQRHCHEVKRGRGNVAPLTFSIVTPVFLHSISILAINPSIQEVHKSSKRCHDDTERL